MQICEIEYALSGAVENMAMDATMLDFTGNQGQALWRLYGWSEPAITFGYSQRWSWIRNKMAGFDGKCIRRQTGGGIVDHRNDLTYALTIPSTHEYYREPALNVYMCLHQQIAEIFLDLGIQADLAPCKQDCGPGTTVSGMCFQQAEPYDVIATLSGAKLAGAAMKRSQPGILVQGSLNRQLMPGLSDSRFEREFGGRLASWLNAESHAFKGKLPSERMAENRLRFASKNWNEKR